MYKIVDARWPNKPYCFSSDGSNHLAIYNNKEEAEKICDKMNSVTRLTKYLVIEY